MTPTPEAIKAAIIAHRASWRDSRTDEQRMADALAAYESAMEAAGFVRVPASPTCKHANHGVIFDEVYRGVSCDVYECKDCGHHWRRAWDDSDPRAMIAALEVGQNTAIEAMMEAQRARRAAESSLAETRAKVEGLEKIVEELRPMIDADGKFNTLVWAERQPRLLAALYALPEAKPAAQADDAAPEVKP
jgi:hypothetical protein